MSITQFHKEKVTARLIGDWWFNSEPFSIDDLKGNVILLELWNSTSLSSIVSLRLNQQLLSKYEEFGFVIIGIHSPQFVFEENYKNIERVIHHYDVKYPVIVDNKYRIWSNLGLYHKTTKVLIDREGFLRSIFGESFNLLEFERSIQTLLAERYLKRDFPPLFSFNSESMPSTFDRTIKTIHTGYLKGGIGNIEQSNLEGTTDYAESPLLIQNRFYLSGKWRYERERSTFDGESNDVGKVGIRYVGKEVYCVMGISKMETIEIELKQGSKYLNKANKGDDVTITHSDKSIVQVNYPRLYSLIKNESIEENELNLIIAEPLFEIYCFAISLESFSLPPKSN